jgi:hypothetical protein
MCFLGQNYLNVLLHSSLKRTAWRISYFYFCNFDVKFFTIFQAAGYRDIYESSNGPFHIGPFIKHNPNPGGLDSRDQSRSRCLDTLRCRFSNCRENLDCQDLVFELSRKSRLSRCRFSNCRENLDCGDWLFFGVEIEISIEITSRQIETPRVT